MAGSPVVAGDSFAAGLRAEFLGTYKRMYESKRAILERVMRLGIPSTRRTEDYFYWNAAPHVIRWVRGESMTSGGFGGVKFSVLNHRWARAIEWYNEDLQDDQTKSLMQHASQLGESAAGVAERIFFQMIRVATDADLLPAVPSAPDGAAIWAATAAGAARFGATGGNIVTGGGVTTTALIRTDYWKARQQFKLFQDGVGQPLLDESATDGSCMVIYGAANEQIFNETFNRDLFHSVVSTTGAAVSDDLLAVGKRPILWSTQRITDNDWIVALTGTLIKAVFEQTREAMQQQTATYSNSDRSRETGIESIRFWMRSGFGVALPYSAIQINN